MKLQRMLSLLSLVALLIATFAPLQVAQAAEFTKSGVIFESMDEENPVSTTVGDRVIVYFKPATVATETTMKITFPSAFTVDATAGNWTIATTNLPASISGDTVNAAPSIATANLVAGQAVTFPVGDLTVGTMYAFAITGGLTTPSIGADTEYTNGIVASQIAGPTTNDSTEWATEILNTTGGDNVAVSATVDANFEFTLDTTAVALGTLSDAAIATSAGNQVTIATNAEAGWSVLVKSANTGLVSSTPDVNTIDSVGTIDGTPQTAAAGAEHYGIFVDSGAGTANGANGTSTTTSIAAEYTNAADAATKYGSLNSTGYAELGSGNGTTDGDSLTFKVRAAIGDWTAEATDYADTLTVVGTGNF